MFKERLMLVEVFPIFNIFERAVTIFSLYFISVFNYSIDGYLKIRLFNNSEFGFDDFKIIKSESYGCEGTKIGVYSDIIESRIV
jgi:hypothetical protein